MQKSGFRYAPPATALLEAKFSLSVCLSAGANRQKLLYKHTPKCQIILTYLKIQLFDYLQNSLQFSSTIFRSQNTTLLEIL